MVNWKRVGNGALATAVDCVVLGGITLFAGAVFNFWGSRGVNDVYKFEFQGVPASVKRDNRILAKDKYWIQMGNSRVFDGEFSTDDGKKVYVGRSDSKTYSVREK